MSYSLSPLLKPRFFTNSTNAPLFGGKLFTYYSGTTTLAVSYSDGEGTENTNPIILDVNGECNLYLDDDIAYRLILKDANDVVYFDRDNLYSIGNSAGAAANSASNADTYKNQARDYALSAELSATSANTYKNQTQAQAAISTENAEQTELDVISTNADAAAAAADRVQTAADRVQTGLDVIAAEAARDAAQLSAGVYATTAAGIAATTNGQYFSVPQASPNNTFLDLYKNVSSVATFVNTYPSKYFFDALKSILTVDITPGGITLTANQAAYGYIIFVGSPTGDQNIAVPDNWSGLVKNGLSNTSQLTVKTASGTGVVIPKDATFDIFADGTNVVQVRKAYAYARRVVTGRVISRSYDGSGNLVVSTTGGAVYEENNSGNPKYGIASVSNATLAANKALVVDLDSASDGNGNKVPSVVSLASSSQTGWQYGNKIVLIANKSLTTSAKSYAGEYFIDCPDPDNDSATNARRGRRVVDGRITSVEYASDSITVQYTQGRVYDENNAGSPKYKINSGSATLTANQALIVDLDGTVDGNGRLTPTIANIASGAQTGWQYGNKLVLCSCSTASSSSTSSADLIFGGGAYKLDIHRDVDLIQVIQTPTSVKVFSKSAIPSSDRFTRFALVRRTNVPTKFDVWHTEGAWDSNLVAWNETKLQEILRTAGAEVELAVKVNGAADFVGGSTHGYQEQSELALFADGVKISMNQTSNYKCRTLEAYQKSSLYFCGTSTLLATVWQWWQWSRGELILTTTFEFAAVATLDFLYAGILPVWRTRGSGSSSSGSAVEIVTAGRRSPKFEEEVIDTSGYASVYSDAAILRGYGTGGYHWSIEKLAGWDKPNRRARFAPEVDNKFYQDAVGAGYVTTIGETITIKSKIVVHNPN